MANEQHTSVEFDFTLTLFCFLVHRRWWGVGWEWLLLPDQVTPGRLHDQTTTHTEHKQRPALHWPAPYRWAAGGYGTKCTASIGERRRQRIVPPSKLPCKCCRISSIRLWKKGGQLNCLRQNWYGIPWFKSIDQHEYGLPIVESIWVICVTLDIPPENCKPCFYW